MSRILVPVFALMFLCQCGACNMKEEQPPQVNNGSPNDLNVLLSPSSLPDNPWMLTLTIVNTSEHVTHIAEIHGTPSPEPMLKLYASQGKNTIDLRSRRWWRTVAPSTYFPPRRNIPPHEKVQYSLNLSSDFIDAYEPYGKTLQQIAVFDHKQPIFVWVEIPDADQNGVDVTHASNRVLLNFNQ